MAIEVVTPAVSERTPRKNEEIWNQSVFEFAEYAACCFTRNPAQEALLAQDVEDDAARRAWVGKVAVEVISANNPGGPRSLSEHLLHSFRPEPVLSPVEYTELLERAVIGRDMTPAGEEGSTAGIIDQGLHVRVSYSGGTIPDLQALMRCGVYNRPAPNGTENNPDAPPKGPPEGAVISLTWPESRLIRDAVSSLVASQKPVAILPFHREPFVGANIDYATEVLGVDNVLAVGTGLCDDSRKKADRSFRALGVADTTRSLIDQSKLLACVDWAKVYDVSGIPRRMQGDCVVPPLGSKGLTLFAGLLALHGLGKLEGRPVIFHDTDIVNPRAYDAIRMTLAALAIPCGNDWSSVYTAKTGPGRNNEIQTLTVNAILREQGGFNDPVRKAAATLLSLIWPLTGERIIQGSELMKVPWTSGMSIETQLNCYFAGKQAHEGRPLVAQVCNAVPKRENLGVSAPREFALMDTCRTHLKNVFAFMQESGVFVHEMSPTEIHKFNRQFGGRELGGAFQQDQHAPQLVRKFTTDFMLPSLKTMLDLGVIDMARLQHALGLTGSAPAGHPADALNN